MSLNHSSSLFRILKSDLFTKILLIISIRGLFQRLEILQINIFETFGLFGFVGTKSKNDLWSEIQRLVNKN